MTCKTEFFAVCQAWQLGQLFAKVNLAFRKCFLCSQCFFLHFSPILLKSKNNERVLDSKNGFRIQFESDFQIFIWSLNDIEFKDCHKMLCAVVDKDLKYWIKRNYVMFKYKKLSTKSFGLVDIINYSVWHDLWCHHFLS